MSIMRIPNPNVVEHMLLRNFEPLSAFHIILASFE